MATFTRYLILLLFLPVMSQAQVSTSLQDGGYFYVVVGQDTVSQHVRVDKAIESASNYSEWQIVQDFRLNGSSTFYDEDIIIEEVTDTVFVDREVIVRDTIYADTLAIQSTHQPAHHALFSEVDFSMGHDSTGNNRTISFVIDTQGNVDTLYTEIRCGNEWVENNVFTSPAETLQYGIFWDCSSPLTYQFQAVNEFGWSETITNSYPLWMTEYELPGASYSLLWGDMTWTYDETLYMELAERNIARIKDESVPVHRNIEVTVTEIVDTTHSTGVHFALRTSEEPQLHSVETYLNGNGMGVSIFSDGVWSNPINFPVQWEYGVPITYRLQLVDDTLTIIVNGETYSYTDEIIGNTPDGYLSIGSTGAGTYYLQNIEVQTLD